MKKIFPLTVFSFIVGCFYAEPKYLNANDVVDAKIQPQKALELASPYIDEHATYNWNPKKPLVTHIVKYRKWYYVKRTNYPAKTFRYYLQPAVRVHAQTGEISFVKK